ncbi:hypothetical protein GCM10007301_43650 [Azorhizobium oxalatiphilum]|uniref:Uncharacterized protein n=1 Tax=Azorhizobium oxalatiphilum TaxID=980631 RepID=A0A917CAY3_9HYPH|nr:hypothetical protein [Azorhizobium oxalatiphilum]GGF78906.1 hypothetical protein GCM10007301_43650 [Azorhizobium oxalatiphilum]
MRRTKHFLPGHSLLRAALWPLCALAALMPLPGHAETPEWPCIQRKVVTLTAAQMWDGPDVEGLTGFQDDAEMGRLIRLLISRATPAEKASAALETWAGTQPETTRDEKLKLLFAGVLKSINEDRAAVISGIERFQRRQRELSQRIEAQGVTLGQLQAKNATDDKSRAELKAAEDRYKWDTRFFAERQDALPYACEIPVEIEQRAFQLARDIRGLMKD